MEHPSWDAALLLRVIALVCVLVSLAWGIMAGPARLARNSTVRFLCANLLLLLAVYLTLWRAEASGQLANWLAFWLADMVGLVAIVLFRQGVQRLLGQPSHLAETVLVLVLAGVGMGVFMVPEPDVRMRPLVFSLAGGWLAAQLFRHCVTGLRAHYGVLTATAGAAVFGILAAMMVARALGLALWPQQAVPLEATSVGASVGILWASLTQVLLVNMTLASLLILHLVARIHHLAQRDALTGCLSRRAIQQRIDDETQRLARMRPTDGQGSTLRAALVMFDVDHFKRINDSLGHAAGDAALQFIAAVVRTELRKVDAFGRWGGEEFLIVLPMTDAAQAYEVAERIRAALAGAPWNWHGKHTVLTASFAVAELTVAGMAFEALDAALYRAKDAGRNCVMVADPSAVASPASAQPGLQE